MEVYFEGTIGIRKWLRIRKNRISTLEELTKLVIKHEPRELTIHINSLGGSTYQALAIYFYLLSLSIPVTTFCHGQVASAATIIAQAGKRDIWIKMQKSLFILLGLIQVMQLLLDF